jgi:hypothetical protein
MTILKNIRVYISRNAKKRPTFQVNFGGVDILYNIHLEKNINFVSKHINIYLTNKKTELGIRNDVKNFTDVYEIFDFYEYEDLKDSYSKSKMVIDSIQRAIISCCEFHNINTDSFIKTYQRCYEESLTCKWFFNNKLFVSPDKTKRFGLEHMVDFEGFKIYEVLHNSQKEEITRRICFKSNTTTFTVKWASWQESNDIFYYSFGSSPSKFIAGPKKIFECNIEQLVMGIQKQLPTKVSDYFKITQ